MSAFIIEVADTKEGVLYPNIIGPFENDAEAEDFARIFGLGLKAQMGDGGYSAYHIVSENTCNYCPNSYIDNHQEEEPSDHS